MIRARKIRLYPNNVQAAYFAKACGTARFACNWGLAEWERRREAGE
ncbi:MAG: helix-turn-helix domain-containing protein [Clostridiales bacterium]|nr:helix-turn-helix domain-containing protein [Clostridiales bacterium]